MDKYGSLTIIGEAPKKISPSGQTSRCVICKCDCGKIKTILFNNLRKGNTKSCGECNHISADIIKCSKCGLEKNKGEFYKGLRCRSCRKRIKPKEQGLSHAKTYRKRHPERVKISYNKWYGRNKNYVKIKRKERENSPLGKIKAQQYLDRTRDRRNAMRSNWRKNMPIESKLKRTLRNRFYKVIIRLKRGRKSKSALELVGCDVSYLKLYLERQFTKGMDWANYGFGKGKWTIDHILPLDCFDLFNLEEQKKAFHYTNLQPMWGTDNFKKSNKVA